MIIVNQNVMIPFWWSLSKNCRCNLFLLWIFSDDEMESRLSMASRKRTRRLPTLQKRKTPRANHRQIRAHIGDLIPVRLSLFQIELLKRKFELKSTEKDAKWSIYDPILPVKAKAAILLRSQGGAHSASMAYIAGKVTPYLERWDLISPWTVQNKNEIYLSQSHQDATEDQERIAGSGGPRSQQGKDGRAEDTVA